MVSFMVKTSKNLVNSKFRSMETRYFFWGYYKIEGPNSGAIDNAAKCHRHLLKHMATPRECPMD